MALVQLASGDWFPEELLPVRNGQRYDPTARENGGAGAPPPQTNIAEAGQPAVMTGYVPPSQQDIQSRYNDPNSNAGQNLIQALMGANPSTPIATPTIPLPQNTNSSWVPTANPPLNGPGGGATGSLAGNAPSALQAALSGPPAAQAQNVEPTPPGRYNVKVRNMNGSIGYSTITFPSSSYKNLDDFAKRNIEANGLQVLGVEPSSAGTVTPGMQQAVQSFNTSRGVATPQAQQPQVLQPTVTTSSPLQAALTSTAAPNILNSTSDADPYGLHASGMFGAPATPPTPVTAAPPPQPTQPPQNPPGGGSDPLIRVLSPTVSSSSPTNAPMPISGTNQIIPQGQSQSRAQTPAELTQGGQIVPGSANDPYANYWNGNQYSFTLTNPANGQGASFGSSVTPAQVQKWQDYLGWQLQAPRQGMDGTAGRTYQPSTATVPAGTAPPDATPGGGTSPSDGGTQPSGTAQGGSVPNGDYTNGFQIRFKGPNGEWKFSKDINEIGQLLSQGYKPIHDDGTEVGIEQFNGGLLFDGLPINTVLTGTMSEDQRRAMIAGGKNVPSDVQVVNGTAPAGPSSTATTGGTAGGTAGGGTSTNTNNATNGYMGNQNAVATPPLNSDLEKALMQLMQDARDQGVRGQEALSGITNDYRNFLNSTQSGLDQTRARQDSLVNALLGGPMNGLQGGGIGTPNGGYQVPLRGPDGQVVYSNDVGTIDGYIGAGYKPLRSDGTEAVVEPFQGGNLIDGRPINAVITGHMTAEQSRALAAAGRPIPQTDSVDQPQPPGLLAGIQSAMATMNDATGLSPEAMAALRQQAIEAPQRDYQQQVQQLKTQLGARGAYGGGMMPGDLNATLSGYAPLMASRDQSRENLLAQTLLANEQRKFDTLGLNRNTAAQFGNIASGLTTGLANAYQPNAYLGAQQNALSGLLNSVNDRTAAGFQGVNSAGQIGQGILSEQPSSFKNTLLSALMGTGFGTLTQVLSNVLNDKTPTGGTKSPTQTTSNGGGAGGILGGVGSILGGLGGILNGGNTGQGILSNQLGAPKGGSLIL